MAFRISTRSKLISTMPRKFVLDGKIEHLGPCKPLPVVSDEYIVTHSVGSLTEVVGLKKDALDMKKTPPEHVDDEKSKKMVKLTARKSDQSRSNPKVQSFAAFMCKDESSP